LLNLFQEYFPDNSVSCKNCIYLGCLFFIFSKVLMSTRSIIIIAFKEFDNLGVGYLASVLSSEGYNPRIIDIRDGKKEILNEINKTKPFIVGFSVIFQYYINDFKELVDYLRNSGVSSHFSAGGQYASMRYYELFNLIPSLDSIIRFEGEYSFLDLVNSIYSGTGWKNIKGLVFKENGKIISNPIRQPEMDLDKFPIPIRSQPEEYVLGKRFATIIAGRGCVNNCSFCNNTEYLKQASFPIKRLRKPEKVVEELEFLYKNKHCSVFLFEDDDFPVKNITGSDWIERFCNELENRNLVGKIVWKINCRPDEIEFDRFSLMKKHGLFLAFLGIDDGTDDGLTSLNKHMTVEESLRGINILKKLKIGFDYGFMLFQPSSTFGSINKNMDFLRQICGDGTTPVTFLKLSPFFDTRVEKELTKAGRLKGNPGFYDYDFLNPSLDLYFNFIQDSFMEWNNDEEGLVNIEKWARNYFLVFSHFFDSNSEVEALWLKTNKYIAESNFYILDRMQELSAIFEKGGLNNGNFENLTKYKINIKEKHDHYKEQVGNSVQRLSRIAEYQRLRHSFPGLLR